MRSRFVAGVATTRLPRGYVAESILGHSGLRKVAPNMRLLEDARRGRSRLELGRAEGARGTGSGAPLIKADAPVPIKQPAAGLDRQSADKVPHDAAGAAGFAVLAGFAGLARVAKQKCSTDCVPPRTWPAVLSCRSIHRWPQSA